MLSKEPCDACRLNRLNSKSIASLPFRRTSASPARHQLDGLHHLCPGDGPHAGLLAPQPDKLDALVQLLHRGGRVALTLLDHPLLGAQRRIQLVDWRQPQVEHAVRPRLGGERGDGERLVRLAGPVAQVEVALVVRARHPGRSRAAGRIPVAVGRLVARLLADEAVGEDEGTLVRAHLLRGVVRALDAPDSKLRVSALDSRRNAVGQLVGAVKVRRLDDGLPRRRRPAVSEALEVLGRRLARPEHGPVLLAVLLDLHGGERVAGVVELPELGGDGGRADRLGPLVEEAVDELVHLRLERRADAELVLEDHLLQVLEAAGEVLDPAGGALQLVGRADVEHQVAVQDRDNLSWGHVFGQELGVSWLCAAVAADEDVEALFRGDQTEVLALGLGTLSHTSAYTSLDLVRRANTLVALLQPHCHADTVADAEAAPRRSHAALDSPERLCVGVAGFHACGDELAPDVEEFVFLGAEQVYALASGDLCVEVVLLGHLGDGQQLVRRDLAAGYPGDDGVGSIALDVAQEPIVGVLQTVGGLIHDMLVPQRRHDARHSRFAQLATETRLVVADFSHHLLQRLEALYHDDVV